MTTSAIERAEVARRQALQRVAEEERRKRMDEAIDEELARMASTAPYDRY